MTLTTEELAALRAQLAGITRGPWEHEYCTIGHSSGPCSGRSVVWVVTERGCDDRRRIR
jgi:hypothetical protein